MDLVYICCLNSRTAAGDGFVLGSNGVRGSCWSLVVDILVCLFTPVDCAVAAPCVGGLGGCDGSNDGLVLSLFAAAIGRATACCCRCSLVLGSDGSSDGLVLSLFAGWVRGLAEIGLQ
jgi:hypothetical protein